MKIKKDPKDLPLNKKENLTKSAKAPSKKSSKKSKAKEIIERKTEIFSFDNYIKSLILNQFEFYNDTQFFNKNMV